MLHANKCSEPFVVDWIKVRSYINRVDPYAYKDPEIEESRFSVSKDELTDHCALSFELCNRAGPTYYFDGMLISVVDNDDSYIVKYVPASSKGNVMMEFKANYRHSDPVLMDAICDYFMSHKGTHLYAQKRNGHLHYGVQQDDDIVYEGTIKL